MKVRTRFALLSLAAGAALLVGAVLEAPAGAAPGDPPQSGDPRATAVAGNATTCADAGLAGEDVTDQLDVTIDATNTYITINSVPDDITLTGIVVKGGPAYNVYPGTALTNLHAPLVSSGKPAQISHWFACGVKTTSSSTPPPSPTETPSTSSSSSMAGETTSPAAAPVPPSGGGLANTGSPISAIAGLGALLVLAGIAMLVLPVARRRWVASRG